MGCGAATATWGIYILAIGGCILDTLPIYDEATLHLPSWAWARAGVAIGLIQAGVAIGALRWPRLQSWPRRAAGLAMMTFWIALGNLMLQAGASPMGAFLIAFAIMNTPIVLLPLLRPTW